MLKKLSLVTSVCLVLTSCSPYQSKVAPVPLPVMHNEHVNVEGVLLLARAYVDPEIAKTTFGYDIRGAGILPVRVVIDNQSSHRVRLLGEQTFLVDLQAQAWPLLSIEQVNTRIQDEVKVTETIAGTAQPALLMGAAGALAGLAIGILTGDNIGTAAAKGAVLGGAAGAIYGGVTENSAVETSITTDNEHHSLRNESINKGALAYGYLFFPGMDEAKSAQTLRLAIKINGKRHNVSLPLLIAH